MTDVTLNASTTRLRATVVAVLSTTSGFLPVHLTAAQAVQIRADLGLSEAQLGLAFSVFFGISGATSVFGGRFVDRIGWSRATRASSIAIILALALIASTVTTYASLVLLLSFAGVSAAVGVPAANLLLAREIPVRRQGVVFGLKQAAGPVAALLAGLAVPTIALTVGWRWAFVLAVAVPATTVLAVPRSTPHPPVPDRGSTGTGPVALRPLLTLAVGGTLASATVGALTTFVVLSVVDAGVAEASAGALVAAGSGVGIAVRVAGGWLADRYGSSGLRPGAHLLAAGTVGFLLLATHQPALAVPGVLIGYGAGWAWPGLYQFGIVRYHPDAPASATGVVRTGLASGAALGPLAFGLLIEPLGFTGVWLIVAGVAASSAVFIAFGARQLAATRPLPPVPTSAPAADQAL